MRVNKTRWEYIDIWIGKTTFFVRSYCCCLSFLFYSFYLFFFCSPNLWFVEIRTNIITSIIVLPVLMSHSIYGVPTKRWNERKKQKILTVLVNKLCDPVRVAAGHWPLPLNNLDDDVHNTLSYQGRMPYCLIIKYAFREKVATCELFDMLRIVLI